MGGQLWAKIALNLAENPKVIGLSDKAFRAFIEAILYSRKHLTDGFLDARVVNKMWGEEAARELSTNDPSNPSWVAVDGGYIIHSFCEYQTTSDDISEMKAKKSKAGQASAAKRREQKATEAQQAVEVVLNTEATQGQPETETETETETEKVSLLSRPVNSTIQADWKPTPEGYEEAKAIAPGANIDYHLAKFIDHHLAKGTNSFDWGAMFRNWMRQAIEFDPELAIPNRPKKQFTANMSEEE